MTATTRAPLLALLLLSPACSDDPAGGGGGGGNEGEGPAEGEGEGPAEGEGEPPSPPPWLVGERLAQDGAGELGRLETPWGGVFIVRLVGTPREMGRQYGALLGERIPEVWNRFMDYAAEEAGFGDGQVMSGIFGTVLDQVWDYMAPHVPPAFVEELEGLAEGADAAGADFGGDGGAGVAQVARRMVAMVEIATVEEMSFDDLAGMTAFLETGRSLELRRLFGEVEGDAPQEHAAWRPARARLPFSTCSFFAAWGDNTQGGRLFASRNLDWTSNTGINDYALISVYLPAEGHAYATVGYVGLPGAIAGLSEEGLAVSHVGATSALERLQAMPGMLKTREILREGESLDDVLRYISNEVDDGTSRPNSVGANVLGAWGDPHGGGASAQAAVIENSGAYTAVHVHRPDCSVEGHLYVFDAAGALAESLTDAEHPDRVNLEADACESDVDGEVRRFVLDGEGKPTRDEHGRPVEAEDGEPLPVGLPLPCAVYRGDEAMSYEVRRWQFACNGPFSGDGRGLMVDSGSYRGRYRLQHEMITAWLAGTAWSRDGREVIPDAGGQRRPIGPEEAVSLARESAMSSNILSVAYDATGLVLYVAFEAGSGDAWEPASQQEYVPVSLAALLGRE